MSAQSVFTHNTSTKTSAASLSTLFWKVTISLGFLGALVALVLSLQPQKKVAYVETNVILEKYEGMLDARKEFDNKMKSWSANIDTLAKEYEADLQAYETAKAGMSAQDRQAKEKQLEQMRTRFANYRDAINQQAQESDAKGTEAVLSQVNDFLKKYGKSHGYAMIYGATGQGNILYADEGLNITEEVLAAMNRSYNGR